MNRSNLLWTPCETAQLDWSTPQTPRSVQYGDIYYSLAGGLEESRYVFLAGNGLPQRFDHHPHAEFCIVETGFGTGLNFLLTWSNWLAQAEPKPALHFISIEKHPLSRHDLERALAAWPEFAEPARLLLAQYPPAVRGQHRLLFNAGRVTLDLWLEDALEALPDLAASGRRPVDAWFLDGFAPTRNAAMWNPSLYRAMHAASREGATFATFTAAGDVRRQLTESGFNVVKAPGFGHKRECLRGNFSHNGHEPTPTDTAWERAPRNKARPQTALVIGAGLAGCTVAAALARRGIEVTMLEQNTVAGAGSANLQGILYTRLSTHHSGLGDFALQSYLFALRYYQQLFASGALSPSIDGDLGGCFHQSERVKEMAALSEVLTALPDFAQVLDATQASTLLGATQHKGGYWYPGAGWLHPAAVCRALLTQAGIRLIENTGPVEVQPRDEGWQASAKGGVLAQADCAVICTASASHADLHWLPLQAIRGQTTQLPASALAPALHTSLCHSGYIAPARAGEHCIGATFDLDDTCTEVRSEDHRRNLDALATAVPQWADALNALDATALNGRVGFRCATPDYLPIAGPVPDHDGFMSHFAALGQNARRTIAQPGPYQRGLYVNTGHGSRGLTSTPLIAELIAAEVCAEALPMSRELYRAVAPGRFIIRKLRRGRA